MNVLPRPALRSRVWPAVAVLAAVLAITLCTTGAEGPLSVVMPAVIAGTAVAAAIWAVWRRRADRADYEARLTAWAASEAVLAERMRIARDLHDIVSHGLGLITVRAAATRHLAKPPEIEAALADIEEAGRHATGELRRMLAVLRAPDASPPRAPVEGLDAVPDIVRGAEVAGMRTLLETDDLGAVSRGVQVAVCQTVREALSNAARHAGPTRVRVHLYRDGPAVVVTVADGGPVDGWRATPGAGHGLAGLRERVTSLGGTLLAERVEGGFRVTARIPDDGSAA
ncbi:sensor histidine kinase [Jidongwangia harbinensis]|uniref:sensor histidine kinase n=1 Tax=Jidongwangia harbinensis TaxID=2878561 RepID=UPI001CD9A3AF|nr:histidine kinase [Jidongwangia harbinensis]MCA2219163.1 histidine kinase [Jidongwangia harbinensis]